MDYIKESMQIIANICSLDVASIQESYEKPNYRIFSIPKRSGGKRTIHAPEGITKLVQQRLYEKFFIKLSYHRTIPANIFGGLKKTSTMGHVSVHTERLSKFLVKMDLKNAFHCVNENALSRAIYDLFCEEVSIVRYRRFPDKDKSFYVLDTDKRLEKWSRSFSFDNEERLRKKVLSSFDEDFIQMRDYLGKRYGNYKPVLFRKKDNEDLWFMIGNGSDDEKLKRLFLKISKIISRIVTYKKVMVQGCTTSPVLMALMVARTELLETFSKGLSSDTVSIYVDDLVISTDLESKEEIQQKISSLVGYIESSTIWKFNRKKTRIYDLSKEYPILTGLRIKIVEKDVSNKEKVLEMEATLPKKLQKLIRSCLHRAKQSEDFDQVMVAEGYIAYLVSVYGDVRKIPSVIKTQLFKYFDTTDLTFLQSRTLKIRPRPLLDFEIRCFVEKHRMTPNELTAQNLW